MKDFGLPPGPDGLMKHPFRVHYLTREVRFIMSLPHFCCHVCSFHFSDVF